MGVLIGIIIIGGLVVGAVSLAGRVVARRLRTQPGALGEADIALRVGADGSYERVVPTEDGAALAVTVLRPPARSDGTTVVLSHGWGAGRRIWGGVARRLVDAGHTVVVYDQRGHGESTVGSDPIGIERLAQDLTTVLEELDVNGAVVVGHSGGGFAAMAYAVGAGAGAGAGAGPGSSGRVRALALVSSAAHDQDTSRFEGGLMGSRALSWVAARPRVGLLPLRQTLGERPGFAAVDAVREMFAGTPASVRGDCFKSSRGMDLRAGLANVDLPAVVLHGAKDSVIAPRLGQAVAASIPDARFEELPGVGHMVPLEAPDRVVAAVASLASPATPSP